MGVNLLIIETDTTFRNNLVGRLPGEKWRILFAERQAEAKKIVKRQKIDVVLIGLNALKQEGLLILKMIKKVRPFTEVIIINSSEQIVLSIEGMKLGAFDDFLIPFDIDSLIRRIEDACRQKKQREASKKSLFCRYQDIMIAATFAEAGESGMAKEFLEKEEKNSPGKTTGKGAKNERD